MNKTNTALGIAWIVLGAAATWDNAYGAWRLTLAPGVSIAAIPWLLLYIAGGLAFIAAGIGMLSRRKWAWIGAAVSSIILLLYSGVMLGALAFVAVSSRPGSATSNVYSPLRVVIMALMVALGVITLLRCFSPRRPWLRVV